MTTMTQKAAQHVFESLRKGLVPERSIDAFAVGIEIANAVRAVNHVHGAF